jgi:hypothetical protein
MIQQAHAQHLRITTKEEQDTLIERHNLSFSPSIDDQEIRFRMPEANLQDGFAHARWSLEGN